MQQDVVKVSIEAEADAAEVEVVEQLMDSLGVTAEVTPRLGRYGGGPAPWAMAIEATADFYERLAQAAGSEPGEALGLFVARVYEVRRRPDRPDGSIRIQDGERTATVTEQVSPEGLRELAAGELAGGATYFWDDGGWQGL